MSTRQPITAGDGILAQPKRHYIIEEHLDLIEKTIESLKAEEAAGTPVDHEHLVGMEEQLKKLRQDRENL